MRKMLLPWWACVFLALSASANDAGESLRFRGKAAARMERLRPAMGRVLFDTGISDPPLDPYDTVLLHGFMPDEHVRLELAVAAPRGFGPRWMPAEVRRFPNGRFWARYRFGGPGRAPLRLRAVDRGIRNEHVFELYDVELFVGGTGPDAGVSAGAVPGRSRVSSGAYEFVGREAWGAKPAAAAYVEHIPGKITMHHTAGRKPRTCDEAVEEMRFLQDYHQNGRGWIDIGYHFVISPTGHVFQGRPENVQGAHVLNQNAGNLGVSFMGNFHPPTSHEPAGESLRAFVSLGRRLVFDYHIPIEDIRAHRELAATDCPGDNLYAQLPVLKARISDQTAPAPGLGFAMPRLPREDFPAESPLMRLPW